MYHTSDGLRVWDFIELKVHMAPFSKRPDRHGLSETEAMIVHDMLARKGVTLANDN